MPKYPKPLLRLNQVIMAQANKVMFKYPTENLPPRLASQKNISQAISPLCLAIEWVCLACSDKPASRDQLLLHDPRRVTQVLWYLNLFGILGYPQRTTHVLDTKCSQTPTMSNQATRDHCPRTPWWETQLLEYWAFYGFFHLYPHSLNY